MVLTDDGVAALAAIRARQAVWANALGDLLGEKDIQAATRTIAAALQAVEKQTVPNDRDRASF
jgi:hypothetical protein